MCKISDNTTIFSTSHWEKKFSPFIWVESHYLITLKYKMYIKQVDGDFLAWSKLSFAKVPSWFGYSTFKMIISNPTIHIIEEQQIITSLYNNVHMTIMSSQIENYHSYIFILMTSNSLFCGFNYPNVYLYVLAVSCVLYDWCEELIELSTNSADAGFPCGWRSNLGWVGMDTSH